MEDSAQKLQRFSEITGLKDQDQCVHILEAHGWDLDASIAMFYEMNDNTTKNITSSTETSHPAQSLRSRTPNSLNLTNRNEIAGPSSYTPDNNPVTRPQARNQPGLVWRLITLPFWMIRGGFGIVRGAWGIGYWVAGGFLSYSFNTLGALTSWATNGRQVYNLIGQGASSPSSQFIQRYEAEYGTAHPNFMDSTFAESLRRASEQAKFLFVYLHSSQHANTPSFCRNTLSSEAVISFINENFLAWGGDVRTSEGFQLSNSFKTTTYPFCAIVTSSSNRRVALLQLVEGPISDSALLSVLQHVLEEQSAILVARRAEEEERNLNRRLREEQDEAFRAALRADQELEKKRQEEEERKRKEEEELEEKRRKEELRRAEEIRIATEKAEQLEKRKKEKLALLPPEPPKSPDTTQILIRLPGGERKERRFPCESSVKSVYDFVDSLGLVPHDAYSLVTNFPLKVYGPDAMNITLKEAGLHPQASLFVRQNED